MGEGDGVVMYSYCRARVSLARAKRPCLPRSEKFRSRKLVMYSPGWWCSCTVANKNLIVLSPNIMSQSFASEQSVMIHS